MQDKQMTEKESLAIITEMIGKVKQSFHDTGFGPIMWGSVITVCGLLTFLKSHFGFKLPFDIWLLTIIAIVPQVIFSIKESKAKRVKTYNDVALDFTWIGFGVCMFILGFSIPVMTNGLTSLPNYAAVKDQFKFYDHITAIYLMVYGLPTFVTGGIMKFKPMLYGGILCWVLALASNFTNGKIDMLFTAIAATCAWLIPGILINIRYRKQQTANV